MNFFNGLFGMVLLPLSIINGSFLNEVIRCYPKIVPIYISLCHFSSHCKMWYFLLLFLLPYHFISQQHNHPLP